MKTYSLSLKTHFVYLSTILGLMVFAAQGLKLFDWPLSYAWGAGTLWMFIVFLLNLRRKIGLTKTGLRIQTPFTQVVGDFYSKTPLDILEVKNPKNETTAFLFKGQNLVLFDDYEILMDHVKKVVPDIPTRTQFVSSGAFWLSVLWCANLIFYFVTKNWLDAITWLLTPPFVVGMVILFVKPFSNMTKFEVIDWLGGLGLLVPLIGTIFMSSILPEYEKQLSAELDCGSSSVLGRCYTLEKQICQMVWSQSEAPCKDKYSNDFDPKHPGRLVGYKVTKCRRIDFDKKFRYLRKRSSDTFCSGYFKGLE